MPMEAYESLIIKDGMHLEKFIRLVAVGMMKIFGQLPKEDSKRVHCFEGEIWNQIVLCNQKLKQINPKDYKSSEV